MTLFLFLLDSIRNYTVLNIVYDECKVFSTKERSPFYICIEIYRPEEEIEIENRLKNGLL